MQRTVFTLLGTAEQKGALLKTDSFFTLRKRAAQAMGCGRARGLEGACPGRLPVGRTRRRRNRPEPPWSKNVPSAKKTPYFVVYHNIRKEDTKKRRENIIYNYVLNDLLRLYHLHTFKAVHIGGSTILAGCVHWTCGARPLSQAVRRRAKHCQSGSSDKLLRIF